MEAKRIEGFSNYTMNIARQIFNIAGVEITSKNGRVRLYDDNKKRKSVKVESLKSETIVINKSEEMRRLYNDESKSRLEISELMNLDYAWVDNVISEMIFKARKGEMVKMMKYSSMKDVGKAFSIPLRYVKRLKWL